MIEPIIPNGFKGFCQRQFLLYFYPFPCVSHEREVEPVPAHVLQARERCLEKWGDRRRAWARILGHEIEIAPLPFRKQVDHIVEPRARRRCRLDIPWLPLVNER